MFCRASQGLQPKGLLSLHVFSKLFPGILQVQQGAQSQQEIALCTLPGTASFLPVQGCMTNRWDMIGLTFIKLPMSRVSSKALRKSITGDYKICHCDVTAGVWCIMVAGKNLARPGLNRGDVICTCLAILSTSKKVPESCANGVLPPHT